MSDVELHHGAATDVGLVRDHNEDAYLCAPPVFVVADGMGGHDRGDVASRIVVEEFTALAQAGYDPHRGSAVVDEVLARCQARIAEYDQRQRDGGATSFSAGTTAVVALLVEDAGETKWLLANLGDSRIYRFAGEQLEQISVDHSLVQELIESGEITADEATRHPERHVITRALGGFGTADADYFVLPIVAEERLLLCTDGVTGMLADDYIAELLAGSEDPRDAADRVVTAAVRAGGDDNATAVVIDVVGLSATASFDSDEQRSSLEQKLGARP